MSFTDFSFQAKRALPERGKEKKMDRKSKLIVIGATMLVLGVLWYGIAMMLYTISSIVYSVAIGAGMYLIVAPLVVEVVCTVILIRSRRVKTAVQLLVVSISIWFLFDTGLPFRVVLVNYMLGALTALVALAGCLVLINVWQRPPAK